jgi:hypothetical protein
MDGVVVGVLNDCNEILWNFSIMVFIFSLISLLSFINIIIYLFVVHFSDNNKFIMDMSNKKTWIKKIITRYKNTRIFFIIIELMFFFCVLVVC